MRRRDFLQTASASVAGGLLLPRTASASASDEMSPAAEAVDRRARVARHSPVVRVFESFSALSVGNGAFAFTVDATGLQTFPEDYKELPLATQAEWGWHSFANTGDYKDADALDMYDAHGRQVPYLSGQNGPAGKYLRENPQRLSLGRIGFDLRRRDGSVVRSSDLGNVEQRLDLWTGTIESRFSLENNLVRVWTRVHPTRDLVTIRVETAFLDPSW